MYNINIPVQNSPWYSIGQMAGLLGSTMKDNRDAREGLKQRNDLYAQNAADNQTTLNNNLQNAYNTYDNTKNSTLSNLQGLANTYNQSQSGDNWNAMVNAAKKIDPSFDSSDPNAMTNLINSVQSGSASYLQPYRQAAQAAALAINPNADLKSGTWGTDAYNRGTGNLNYVNNYKTTNDGKKVNGTGTQKWQPFSTYYGNNQNNLVQGALGAGTPIAMTAVTSPATPIDLQQASQLSTNWYDPEQLKQYLRGG